MARGKRRKMSTVEPAQRVLTFAIPPGESYIDIAAALSSVNRRFYRQGMQYAVTKVEFSFPGKPGNADAVELTAFTAGSTWVVHNAWKKAQAHWLGQQRDARRLIGQSAKPAYEDFKVYLDDAQRAAGTTMPVLSGDGAAVGAGEWEYSKFVWEADDASVDEPWVHLIGGNVGSPGTDWGLILNYQQSRATVQAEDPELPAEYSTNMYALLAQDENLSLDEVAQNMETNNDEPPYDHDDYPGSDTNSDRPWPQETAMANAASPNANLHGFVAQCGLILFNLKGFNAAGGAETAPAAAVQVHLAPGGYKGVLAEPMGQ